MARGRFQKKRSPLGPILIILVLAAIAAAVLYFTGVLGHRHHCSAPADCTVARYCDECGKLMEAAHQDQYPQEYKERVFEIIMNRRRKYRYLF